MWDDALAGKNDVGNNALSFMWDDALAAKNDVGNNALSFMWDDALAAKNDVGNNRFDDTDFKIVGSQNVPKEMVFVDASGG
jgi:hypothetical protein